MARRLPFTLLYVAIVDVAFCYERLMSYEDCTGADELEIKLYPLYKCSSVDVLNWFGNTTVFMHVYHPDELTRYAPAMTARTVTFKEKSIEEICRWIEERGFIRNDDGDEQGWSFRRPPHWILKKQFTEPYVDTVKILYDPTGGDVQSMRIKCSTDKKASKRFAFERVLRRFNINCSMHDVKSAMAECPQFKLVDEVVMDVGNGTKYLRIKYQQ